MSYIRQTLLGLCIAAAALGIFAQSTEEHKTHHPESAAPPAAAAAAIIPAAPAPTIINSLFFIMQIKSNYINKTIRP